MSKLKNAELEERALVVADKILTRIESEAKDIPINPEYLQKLIKCYVSLKPYF